MLFFSFFPTFLLDAFERWIGVENQVDMCDLSGDPA
jgi:hypothetical protein